ncbi:hypothetical protein MHZ95_17195 [Sporosarcina sp. ACRSM]|uniref:PilW family protein n=1 Tax=Sporosarcina sp. ACRSM TaxID=2918216 RepID=UPI001EF46E43|nr:hypothetical protein [Sporosarcina sp. ACRSM]MCG7336998.1 hypothetical protein [Sporosarcina sp. ACRSM]
MHKHLSNEKGLTLVELLAVLVTGTIIFLLISNVHLFGQKQYKSQLEKTEHLYDVTYAAKVITREIRKANARVIENVDAKDNHIRLSDSIEYKYNSDTQSIENKEGTPLVKDIKRFYIKKSSSKVNIEIESMTGEKIKTGITLRRGD